MKFRFILAAMVIAALPAVSSAATVSMCDGSGSLGGPYDIASGDVFNCDVTLDPALASDGGLFEFEFYASIAPTSAVAVTANMGLAGDTFTSATLSWWEKGGGLISSVLLSELGTAPYTFGFEGYVGTLFSFTAPAARILKLEWTGYTGNFLDVNITVSAVPLPAGGLLLITGLAGLGLSRRRRHKS